MNLTRFADLIDKEMIWWIYRYIEVTLHKKHLVDPAQHERYLDIACNHKDNMLLFLNAKIVLRCIEDNVKQKDHHMRIYPTHERLENLVECIKQELDHEETMSRLPLMSVGRKTDDVTFNPFETYEEPGVFTNDPVKRGVRVVTKPSHS